MDIDSIEAVRNHDEIQIIEQDDEESSSCAILHIPIDNLPLDHCALCEKQVENETSNQVFGCDHDKYHSKCLKEYLVLPKWRAVRTDRPCPRCHALVNTTYSELMERSKFEQGVDQVCIKTKKSVYCLIMTSCFSSLCLIPLVPLLMRLSAN